MRPVSISLPTIAHIIAEASSHLSAQGVDEPRRTAEALLAHALGVDRTYLLTGSSEEVEAPRYLQYLALIARRASGEPLQYITGHQEFYGRDFNVTPDVLIPRPETEFLVEQVLKLTGAARLADAPMILDVGTGSGCIAVTLAVRFPKARLIATDVSRGALQIARQNAEAHGVARRIEFVEGDLLAPLEGRGLEGAVDIIASNPPYVPASDLAHLQREVRDHEPRVALEGGEDGLDFYRRLIPQSRRFLKPGSYLVCEIGYSQLDAIRATLDPVPWELAEVTHDLQGIPRTLTIRRLD